jgi:hypothetical protein
VSRSIAPVGHTSPQRVQANSHQPRRGTSTGVQNPSTPAWPIAGWRAPVGHACWHSEQRTQRARKELSASAPGGRNIAASAARRPPPATRSKGATTIPVSVLPIR